MDIEVEEFKKLARGKGVRVYPCLYGWPSKYSPIPAELAGGLEELVVSASGFSILDLELLEEILRAYDVSNLWAAVGWFLERFKRTFHVSDETLDRMEFNRPKSPHYLVRSRRGGKLEPRWNLILPDELLRLSEPDAP